MCCGFATSTPVRRVGRVIVEQDAFGRPIEVLELPRPQRREKRHQPHESQEQRHRDQIEEAAHLGAAGRRRLARRKALTTTDSRIMAIAEKLLNEEFAFVLGIDPKDVAAYIRERIPEGVS